MIVFIYYHLLQYLLWINQARNQAQGHYLLKIPWSCFDNQVTYPCTNTVEQMNLIHIGAIFLTASFLFMI